MASTVIGGDDSVQTPVIGNPPVETESVPAPGRAPSVNTRVVGYGDGASSPDVFVDGVPATLNFTPNGDGTYGIEVTM